MTPETPAQVPTENQPLVAPEGATPVAPGQVAAQTPATPPAPVEDAKLTEYEQRLSRFQEDLNRQKSTFQKREYELTQQFEAKERQLREELERARIADMDEDELKIYRQEQAVLQAQELAQQNQSLQNQLQEIQAFNQAYQWFLANDVPASSLVVDQGYDALFQSGWQFINQERQQLRQKTAQPPVAPVSPQTPVTPVAPRVVTSTAGIPATGPTWDELIAKYGSREDVYRLVETGQLPVSVIPGLGK